MSGDFFYGEVRFLNQGLFNAKYSIVQCGSIIKVKNSTHIRLVDNQNHFPGVIKIIAPMGAVKVVSGSIPESYIQFKTANEYLALRQIYQGF